MADLVAIFGTGLRWLGYLALPLWLLPLAIIAAPGALGKSAAALSDLLDGVSGLALRIAIGFAFLIILAQLAIVILSNVYGVSFSWLSDSVVFAFAGIFMLGAAAALRDDGHVRVDILRPKMSDRTRAIVEIFGSLAFIWPIGILLLYGASSSLARSWIGLEPFNESDGLPIKFLFKTLVPLFAVLMMSQGLSQAIKAALSLRGLRGSLPQQDHSVGPA